MRHLFRNPTQQAHFERHGYVLVDLLDQHGVAAARTCFRRFAGHHRKGITPSILSTDLGYRRAVHAEMCQCLQPALDRVLDRVAVCHAGLVVKAPDPAYSGMSLHQDPSWVCEGDHQDLTVWCPLVDTSADNGWLGVVPGSHRLSSGARPAGPFSWPQLAETIHRRHLTYLPMRAGQALLMHPAVFHTSPPNTTPAPRVCAAAMVAPREAPLRFYHHSPEDPPGTVAEYEVAADFYQHHVMGTRPEGRMLALVDQPPADLTPDDLDRTALRHTA